MSIRQVRRSGSVLVNGLNATAGSPVSADTPVVGATVVGDVVVVGGATEDSDGNAESIVAPPHAARRPPVTMTATNLFISTGFHSEMITFSAHLQAA